MAPLEDFGELKRRVLPRDRDSQVIAPASRLHVGNAANQLSDLAFSVKQLAIGVTQRVTGDAPVPRGEPAVLPNCPRAGVGAEPSVADRLEAALNHLQDAQQVLEQLHKETSCG